MTKKKKGEAEKDPGFKGNLLWVSTLGINLVVSGIVGLIIGYWLDKLFKTQPWLTISLFILGTVAGFRQIYKEIQRMAKEDEKRHEQK